MHPNFISFTLRKLLSGYPGRESDVILLVTTCADKNKVAPLVYRGGTIVYLAFHRRVTSSQDEVSYYLHANMT